MNFTEFIDADHYVNGYALHKPCSELQSFVDFIHYPLFNTAYNNQHIKELCFPSFGFNLLFPVTHGYDLTINNKKHNITKENLVPRNTRMITSQHSSQAVVGFKCTLNVLSNTDMNMLMKKGEPVLLDSIIPKHLLKNIRETETIQEKIEQVQLILLNLVNDRHKKNYSAAYVRQSIKMIEARFENKFTARQLSKELFISSKSLSRYFIKYTGQTPKQIFNTIRFRKAVKDYLVNPPAFDLGKFGYFDHSHFYKEVKSFTGFYPHQLYIGSNKKELAFLISLMDKSTI